MEEVTKDILKNIYKPRLSDVRKHEFGLLVVIGGSEFYSGSPAFSAMAAFKAGVDMVRIIAPKRAADIIASFSPNLAAYPLQGEQLTKKHLSTLILMTKSAKVASKGRAAVVIGGGAGRSEETQGVILEYLSETPVPVVIDADAIYAVGKKPEIIFNKPFLITPNTYEFFVLTGKLIRELSEQEKIKTVQEEAAKFKTTILLKGETDIISNGERTALNKISSHYLTKGGCGDTLAGICGALIARGVDIFDAASAAAFINVRAGQIAEQTKKESLLATDLIEAIAEVINLEL